jgi:hypothetical protein
MSGQSSRRVHPKYAPLLTPALTAIAMSLVMSFTPTIARLGLTPHLVSAWLTSFAIGVAAAVPTAVLVAPHAQRLATYLTGAPRRATHDGAHAPGRWNQPPHNRCKHQPVTSNQPANYRQGITPKE